MQLSDFFDRVEEHKDLEGLGLEYGESCDTVNPGVLVRYTPTQLLTRLPVEAVEKAEWPVIEDVLMGRREPRALQHMTRVVGYFSRIENWNRSKLGELKDRQKGVYRVEEAPAARQHGRDAK